MSTTINSTTAATGTTAATAASATSTANADAADRFLKLLVAQMQNQDPLNPMDNAQVTSQMAQINTVTGIEKLNTTVSGLNGQLVQLQALQGATTEKTVEEQPFTGLAELALTLQQLLPQRHQDVLEHHGQWIAGEYLAKHLLQTRFIETTQRALHLLLPLAPFPQQGICRRWLGHRTLALGALEDLAHLADRPPALQPRQNAAHRIDVGLRIQAMTAVGAGWLDQPVAPLPGAQGDWIDPGQARHFTNGKQLFLSQGRCGKG